MHSMFKNLDVTTCKRGHFLEHASNLGCTKSHTGITC